ncbi:MAG: hypothetical protein A4E51_01389 [Methanosaeta sp. PtaU1.Bin055]|nr:MAG: hypothetical protein A4E51_01389 [Methanosaeta sp. PtaU1.Bin055]
MTRETSRRDILRDKRSFSITWGVDTTIFASSHNSLRRSGKISPVKEATMVLSARTFSRNEACCSTRGFVGARKRTLPRFSLAMRTIRAMTVFPRPVGRTTRVEAWRAEAASSSWKSRRSTAFSFSRGCWM